MVVVVGIIAYLFTETIVRVLLSLSLLFAGNVQVLLSLSFCLLKHLFSNALRPMRNVGNLSLMSNLKLCWVRTGPLTTVLYSRIPVNIFN